jgi:hypothetical protein
MIPAFMWISQADIEVPNCALNLYFLAQLACSIMLILAICYSIFHKMVQTISSFFFFYIYSYTTREMKRWIKKNIIMCKKQNICFFIGNAINEKINNKKYYKDILFTTYSTFNSKSPITIFRT